MAQDLPAPIDRQILSDDALVTKYDLTLEPDLERAVFRGSVSISYDVDVATNEIQLHAKQLMFNDAYFLTATGQKIVATEIIFQTKETVVKIVFPDVLPVGKDIGTLVIEEFHGVLNDQMAGFYRSDYIGGTDGKPKRLAVTQFEAIDARRCFPCVDEPARKAVFNCSLIVPNDLKAISNMPVKESTVLVGEGTETGLKPGQWKTQRVKYDFFPTPKMSTYLLAFLVGEFDSISGVTNNGTQITCYSVPGKSHELAFSLDVAIRCLEFYNKFFQVPYPLPKLDMAAIPDFAAGAMENWGLVTYREIDLLCDVSKTSTVMKTRVASVVTHELAHQWFGNLVTMEWWNDLWLNEGFACFMQTFSADKLFPEWKIWEQFVADDQFAALRLDGLRSSHPIQVPIPKAEQVEEIFDAISYCKGGSCVRMLFATLGAEKFQEGLQNYMKKHHHSNTRTFDLWKAWEEVSGKPISLMMKAWTEQMGYPLLMVDYASDNHNGTNGNLKIKVSQKWYLADNSVEKGDDEKKWMIPMFFTSNAGYDISEVQFMKEKTQEFEIKGAGTSASNSWIKLNASQFIPCKVLYSPKLFQNLAKPDSMNQLNSEDRIGLILDTFDLCRSGHNTDTSAPLYLLHSIKDEQNPNVWDSIKMVIDGFEKVMKVYPEIYDSYKNFIGGIVHEPFAVLGWDAKEGDDDLTKHLRGMMVSLNANYNAKNIQNEAEKRYDAFVSDQNTKLLPDDYKRSVFRVMIEHETRGPEVWNQLIKIMTNPKTSQPHRLAIYAVLGYVKDKNLKLETLELCLKPDSIRNQDFFYPMQGVTMSGKDGNEMIFKWMCENYNRIKEVRQLSTASGSLLQSVVHICCTGMTMERANLVEAFFKDKDEPSLVRTLKQVCERTRVAAQFVEIIGKSDVVKKDFWVKTPFNGEGGKSEKWAKRKQTVFV